MPDPITRDLPAGVLTEIAIDFTRPVYLVKMFFPTATVFMSSGPQITFSSDIYIEGQVSVGSFTWNADGSQQGDILLSNENNAASALILNGTPNDVPIEIFQTYLIAGGGNTTPKFYVAGVMNGSSIGESSSIINVLSTTAQFGFVPGRYHTVMEGFNWLPIDGEVITWGDEVFVLRAE